MYAMRPDQPKEFRVKEKNPLQSDLFHSYQHMQHGQAYSSLPNITFGLILQKLWIGIRKLLVALKYQAFRLTAGLFENWRLPWFKIGLAALAVFIVAKKDIRFSIDMKAPLGIAAGQEDEQNRGMHTGGEQMGLAQPVGWKSADSKNSSVISIDQLDANRVRSYVRRFSKVATAEMDKFGIPASVKMAQAVLESHAGEHPACLEANNHFGAPMNGQFFENAWENWRMHSLLLLKELPDLPGKDAGYKRWARALGKSGYSNDKNYAGKLIEVIEKFELFLLDEG